MGFMPLSVTPTVFHWANQTNYTLQVSIVKYTGGIKQSLDMNSTKCVSSSYERMI